MTQINAHDVVREAAEFKLWLSEHGAEVLEPTNEWELIRFRTGKGTSVIYRKKDLNAGCSIIGEGLTAWREFQKPHSSWRAIPRTKRILGKSAVDCNTLRKRDGHNCFFCNRIVDYSDESVEHLVAITHGGPQHISNKYLAHVECNKAAGHLSAVEKIKIHSRAVAATILKDYDAQQRSKQQRRASDRQSIGDFTEPDESPR